MKFKLRTILLLLISNIGLITAQEKVKVEIGGVEKLTIKKNSNGDLQLGTPNINNNLFLGNESGDNITKERIKRYQR